MFEKRPKWSIYWGLGILYVSIFWIAHFFNFQLKYAYEITVIFLVTMLSYRLYEIFKLIQFRSEEQFLIEMPIPKDFLPTFKWIMIGLMLFFNIEAIEGNLLGIGFTGILVFVIIEVFREFYMNHRLVLTPTQLLKITDKIEVFDINDITQITKGEGYLKIDIEDEEHIELLSDIFIGNQRATFLELLEREGFPLLDEGGKSLRRAELDSPDSYRDSQAIR